MTCAVTCGLLGAPGVKSRLLRLRPRPVCLGLCVRARTALATELQKQWANLARRRPDSPADVPVAGAGPAVTTRVLLAGSRLSGFKLPVVAAGVHGTITEHVSHKSWLGVPRRLEFNEMSCPAARAAVTVE